MKFWAALLSALLILSISSIVIYHSYEDTVDSTTPLYLYLNKRTNDTASYNWGSIKLPTRALVQVSCNGEGNLVIYDGITGKAVDNRSIFGHAEYQFIIPHEGEYNAVNSKMDTTLVCSFRVIRNYPTKEVQNALYISGSALALLLALIVWRWGR